MPQLHVTIDNSDTTPGSPYQYAKCIDGSPYKFHISVPPTFGSVAAFDWKKMGSLNDSSRINSIMIEDPEKTFLKNFFSSFSELFSKVANETVDFCRC